MLDLTFTKEGYFEFRRDESAIGKMERTLKGEGYSIENTCSGIKCFSRGHKWAALYAVDIRKYRTEITVDQIREKHRVQWKLYYHLFSFVGWRDLRVLNNEAALIHDAYGCKFTPSGGVTSKVITLNPIYIFFTAVLLFFLLLNGYFLARNNMHRLRPKPVWLDLQAGRNIAQDTGSYLMILYYRPHDPWTKYDMENIFSGKKVTEFLLERRIVPVRVDAEKTGYLPGGVSPFLELYDPAFNIKGRTNLLGTNDDLLDFLSHCAR